MPMCQTPLLRSTFLSTLGIAAFAASVAAPERSAAQQGVGIEEIVVTAQRREESLQTVPVSVTAIGGDNLRLNSVQDINRLEVLVPGLQFGQSGGDARPAIRGSRTEDRSVRADPTVGYYIDEIYKPRSGQHLQPIVDAKRVEVLRGPQGTLFGRNTFGGAFNIVSNQPTFDGIDFGGQVSAGDERTVAAEGFINVPVTDQVAVRVAGTIQRRDGFVQNVFDPSNDLKDDEDALVRGQVRFAEGPVDITVRAKYWTREGNGNGDFGHFALGVPVELATGDTSPSGDFQRITPRRGGEARGVPDDPFTIEFDAPLQMDFEEFSIGGETNFDLGFAMLRGIFAYQDFEGSQNVDGDFGPFPGVIERQFDESETFTAELQFVSQQQGPLEYTAGAYYLDEDATGAFLQDQIFRSQLPDGNGGFEGLQRVDFGPGGEILNDPRALAVNPAARDPDFDFIELSEIETESVALFGQASYTFFEKLRLTGGVRWTRDEKTAVTGFLGGNFTNPANAPGVNNTLPLPDIGPGDFNFGGTNDGPVSETFREVTWRAGVDYELTPENFVYFSASTGFQAGGFNTVPQGDGSLAFDEQRVTAFEAGSKNRFLDGRLTANVAFFFNDFEDLLTQDVLDREGGVVTVARNAGSAQSYGVELELDWTPINALRLGLRISAGEAEFDDFAVANDFQSSGDRELVEGTGLLDVSDQDIPLNPDVTVGFTASYTIAMGNLGKLIPAVNFYFSDDYATSDRNYSFDRQEAYTKTDLRLIYETVDGLWSAQAFVENVEDEHIVNRTVVFGGDLVLQNFNDPRTWGLRVSRNF